MISQGKLSVKLDRFGINKLWRVRVLYDGAVISCYRFLERAEALQEIKEVFIRHEGAAICK